MITPIKKLHFYLEYLYFPTICPNDQGVGHDDSWPETSRAQS